ncbi:MAG: DUF1579 domain-containing protein [Phycisphaerales bacterium]
MSDQATTTPQPDAQDCAAMAATTEAHERFKPFVGTFNAEVKMWMGPGDPMVSSGTMKNSLELGGRYLQQVYEGDDNPNDPFPGFAGRGYWGYNTVDNRYEGFWIDTACTFMMTEQGQVDSSGKVWEMKGEMTDPSSGQPMRKRSVVTLKDKDRHSMEMFFEGPDGNEFKAMEINYTRA